MQAPYGIAEIALVAGVQAFFVVFVWRLGRKLRPVIEWIHGAQATHPGNGATVVQGSLADDAAMQAHRTTGDDPLTAGAHAAWASDTDQAPGMA